MKRLLSIVFVCFSLVSQAQTEAIFQEEINQTVWRPFQEAFENLDAEALNAIYAENVIRVTPEGIDTRGMFKAANLERFAQNKEAGLSISLDFWFDSRHTNGNTSYEVGFYRIGFTDKDGQTNYSYGQFHIVIKKISGVWKICQDWDTTTINGNVIGAEDFTKQQPIRF